MATKTAKRKCTEHDYIAPKGETLDTEARCANCGAAPTSSDLQLALPIRYVDPATWFDTMVALG